MGPFLAYRFTQIFGEDPGGSGEGNYLDVPFRINGDRINGLFHLLINWVYWGYNPLILTIDPNFLGHPSKTHFIMAGQPTPHPPGHVPPSEIWVL